MVIADKHKTAQFLFACHGNAVQPVCNEHTQMFGVLIAIALSILKCCCGACSSKNVSGGYRMKGGLHLDG